MTAQTALRDALRDGFAPAARRAGYRGSAPTWRKVNSDGDVVVVNVQSSSWSTSEDLRCVINIAAAPEPWLRWRRHELGPGMPKTISESLGLFRDRVHPTGTPERVDGWWEVSDQSSAVRSVADMSLRMDDGCWRALDSLLSRTGVLESIRAGSLGHFKREHHEVYFARAEALLLMDDGDSPALEACLRRAMAGTISTQQGNAEAFDLWVRDQAHGHKLLA